MHRVRIIIGNIVFLLANYFFVKIVSTIGRASLSQSAVIRAFAYLPSLLLNNVLGLSAIRAVQHLSGKVKAIKLGRASNRIKNPMLRSYLYASLELKNRNIDSNHFKQLLISEQFDEEVQFQLGHSLFQAGRIDLACVTFAALIDRSPIKLTLARKLQLYRDCGIVHFMHGRIQEANRYWQDAGELRKFILGPAEKGSFRIFGASWFAAIGHVAMLDYYQKYVLLYRDESSRTVVSQQLADMPGNYLISKIRDHSTGLVFLNSDKPSALQIEHDKWAKQHAMRLWHQLTPDEQFARIDDFWEFDFPDGSVLGYTHAAAKTQQEWERRGLKPLLSVSDEEKAYIAHVLETLGLPKDAWYVCLHVREPGFHKNWNTLYPSMRDAEIDDYHLAVEKIVARGGWVIRMGDASMKRFPEMPGVIDYAHSPFKTPTADTLIPLMSRFLLGTNSGYATIPNIYGIRCAFTNWVPIGLPLWSSQDLMIPKLFLDKKQQRYLNLNEIFETGLAFVQNWDDLPADIELIKNTPEDIWALADEMLSITEANASAAAESASKLFYPTYRSIAERHGSYVGSHLGSAFIQSHSTIFTDTNEGGQMPTTQGNAK